MHKTLGALKTAMRTHDVSALPAAFAGCDEHLSSLLASRQYITMADYLQTIQSLGAEYLAHRHSAYPFSQIMAEHFLLTSEQCLAVRFNNIAAQCAAKIADVDQKEKMLLGFSKQGRPSVANGFFDDHTLTERLNNEGIAFIETAALFMTAHAKARTTPPEPWVNFCMKHQDKLLDVTDGMDLGANFVLAAFRFGFKDVFQCLRESIVTSPAKDDFDHLVNLQEIGEVFTPDRKRELYSNASNAIAEKIKLKGWDASADTLIRCIQVHDYHDQGDYSATTGTPCDMWETNEIITVILHLWPQVKKSNPAPLIALLNRDIRDLDVALQLQKDFPKDLFHEIEVSQTHCLEVDLGL